MKKTIVMGLFILSLTLTGCLTKEKVAPAPQTTPTNEESQTAPETKADEPVSLSLSEWFAKKDGVKCSIEIPTGAVNSWILGNKVRIEGVGYDPTEPQEIGHMLSDGEFVYTWAGTKGIKMDSKKIAATTKTDSARSADWQESVVEWENTGVQYNCEKYELTDDFFAVPTDVTFSDMSALLDVTASSTNDKLMNKLEGNTEDVEAALEKAGVTPDMTKVKKEVAE